MLDWTAEVRPAPSAALRLSKNPDAVKEVPFEFLFFPESVAELGRDTLEDQLSERHKLYFHFVCHSSPWQKTKNVGIAIAALIHMLMRSPRVNEFKSSCQSSSNTARV